MIQGIFDAHSHYDDKWFDEDRIDLLSSMNEKGVSHIISSAVDLDSAQKAKALAEQFDFIYITVGFHPENLDNIPLDYLQKITDFLRYEKAVAIGEIGLDYHWDIDKELQKRVFEEQLKLSKELDIPVVVHDREAHKDTLDLLKKYNPKGLLHCFSGSVEMLKEVLKLGMNISLGGTVTFKNARVPVEVAKFVPLDKLLLETDAPYLSPVPFRGKRNDSSMIAYTAEKIAEIKNIDAQKLVDITRENAKTLFNISE